MRILIPLFSPATGTWGGLTRVIAVAEAAQQAGHAVAFCASGSLEEALAKRGFRVYPAPAPTFLGLPGFLSRRIAARSQSAALPVKPGRDFGSIWLVLLISGLGRAGFLSRLLQAEEQAARDFHADALFTDLDPGAFLLARAAGLPIAAAYQTPMSAGIGSLPWQIVNRAVGRVLAERRLPGAPVQEVFHGPRVLKIIPSIPELEGTPENRPDVRYTGHLLGAIHAQAGFSPEPGRRYAFAYLGTGSVPAAALREVLPRVFPAGGPLTCLVGGLGQAAGRLGEVEFRPYVPAAALLPHCDWTICHGGQNTIIQSLAAGVPLLIFPGPIFERRYNARQAQAAGAGRMGELPDFTVEWFRQAMAGQAQAAQRAAALGARICSYGGAAGAVSALQEWAGR